MTIDDTRAGRGTMGGGRWHNAIIATAASPVTTMWAVAVAKEQLVTSGRRYIRFDSIQGHHAIVMACTCCYLLPGYPGGAGGVAIYNSVVYS